MTNPRLSRFVALVALISLCSLPSWGRRDDTANGQMTQAERAYLLSELRISEKNLLSSIKGLTPGQWTFKPSPDSWSIQECAEHLIIVEDRIFGEAQKTLNTPAQPRLVNANREGDRKVVEAMEDRSKKVKTPKILEPSGKFPTPESAAQEFAARRSKTIAYVRTTHDALRIHSGDGPSGSPADVYQFLLELAAHSTRHTAQIREVKSATGYPHS